MIKGLLFIILTAVVFTIFANNFFSITSKPKEAALEIEQRFVSKSTDHKHISANIQLPHECKLSSLDISSQHRSLQFEKNVGEELKKLVESFRDEHILDAPATDFGKVAHFVVAASCSQYGDYLELPRVNNDLVDNLDVKICRKIPLNQLGDLVELIKPQAGSSPNLKVLYAQNLIVLAKILKVSDAVKQQEAVTGMLKEAEHFAKEAVEMGVRDAYIFLSEQYASGGFGYTDLKAAYLYSTALAKIEKTPESEGRVNYIYRNLKSADLKAVSSMVNKCENQNGHVSGALQNPFL